MKKLLILALALASCGCQTLSNVGRMNRYMPQLQRLVVLKEASRTDGPQEILLCGRDVEEMRFLSAAARQMGWEPKMTQFRTSGDDRFCQSLTIGEGN